MADFHDTVMACAEHSRTQNHSYKEACRYFSSAIDPSETEEEFDQTWEKELKPMQSAMKAHNERTVAMTDEERADFVDTQATERGIELTPALRQLGLEMLKTPATCFTDE